MAELTPMMKQYMDIKKEYTDSILFFRLGDFYEMFFEDAEIASKELEITLTQRGVGLKEKAAMCGIPHHVSDGYVAKLVERGYKVAICEQVEDPSEAKGIVRREVVRVVTPGTITDQTILDEKSNNYLVSIYLDEIGIGISYVDNSTGELYTTNLYSSKEDMLNFALNEISKIYPSEIICNENFYKNKKIINIIKNNLNPYFNVFKEKDDDLSEWEKKFEKHFHVLIIDEFNNKDRILSNMATYKLIEYLEETQKNALNHINELFFYEANNYMVMDFSTRTNLEIHQTIISRDKKGSLVGFLDNTSTSMGGRLLRKWLEQPLINIEKINIRHLIVEYFINNLDIKDSVKKSLKGIYDIERLSSKISTGNCNARELISLKNSIGQLPELKAILKGTNNKELMAINKNIDSLQDVYSLIDKSIVEQPPILITEGGIIKKGYDSELDKIKEIAFKGKQWLSDLEEKERKKSGINNLKIGFNKMLGYYFEVTKSNIPKVQDHFHRRQTLTNSERYYTDELKEMENQILSAEDDLLEFEYKIFIEIRETIKKEVDRIQRVSREISKIDVLNSFAETAFKSNFSKPKMNINGVIDIKDGRHPVVENNIENNLFIPNDTYLDLENDMIQIITGPNMAGKSTYMRQVAIITLLSHIGSFVPATSANISIVDRIFTRIGAADNLSQGESTFMVEMNEVSNIVKSATNRSLIILDEVGRGTSTYDGLSIAWSLIEYIAEDIKAKTLFATHYHELTQLEDNYNEVNNLTIVAEEKGEDIVFLRKVIEGSTNKSYGIQVARLAGVHKKIIDRASEILYTIEDSNDINLDKVNEVESKQLKLEDFRTNYYIDNLSKINVNDLSPIEALNRLNDIVKEAQDLRGD